MDFVYQTSLLDQYMATIWFWASLSLQRVTTVISFFLNVSFISKMFYWCRFPCIFILFLSSRFTRNVDLRFDRSIGHIYKKNWLTRTQFESFFLHSTVRATNYIGRKAGYFWGRAPSKWRTKFPRIFVIRKGNNIDQVGNTTKPKAFCFQQTPIKNRIKHKIKK